MCVMECGKTCSRRSTYLPKADAPTGPWRLVTDLKHFGEPGYFVNLPSKFISTDGRTGRLWYSGNFATDWNGEKIKVNLPGPRYGMVLQQIRLLGPGRRQCPPEWAAKRTDFQFPGERRCQALPFGEHCQCDDSTAYSATTAVWRCPRSEIWAAARRKAPGRFRGSGVHSRNEIFAGRSATV